MLEAEALDGVAELDVDAEVVRVELEPVRRRVGGGRAVEASGETGLDVRPLFLHGEDEARDGALYGELPVDVAVRVRLEVRHGRRRVVVTLRIVKH